MGLESGEQYGTVEEVLPVESSGRSWKITATTALAVMCVVGVVSFFSAASVNSPGAAVNSAFTPQMFCDAGHYKTVEGHCNKCRPGTFNGLSAAENDAGECTVCPENTYQPDEMATSCIDCKTVTGEDGDEHQWTICAPGPDCDRHDHIDEDQCAPPSASRRMSIHDQVFCPPGKYVSEAECVKCSP